MLLFLLLFLCQVQGGEVGVEQGASQPASCPPMLLWTNCRCLSLLHTYSGLPSFPLTDSSIMPKPPLSWCHFVDLPFFVGPCCVAVMAAGSPCHPH